MSEVMEISTSGIIREVNARIDGHVYKVRRLGAGDKLDIQNKTTKIALISKKAFNLQSKAKALEKNPENSKDAIDLTDQIGKIMDEVNKAQDELAKCYLKLFDDGTNDQRHSRKLLEKYGAEGLQTLNGRVFDADLNREATNAESA